VPLTGIPLISATAVIAGVGEGVGVCCGVALEWGDAVGCWLGDDVGCWLGLALGLVLVCCTEAGNEPPPPPHPAQIAAVNEKMIAVIETLRLSTANRSIYLPAAIIAA
jgi:hypothetical protein